MPDTDVAGRPHGRPSRPTVVAIVVAAVVIAAIVVFLIVTAAGRGSDDGPNAAPRATAAPTRTPTSDAAPTDPVRPTPAPSTPSASAPHHVGGGAVALGTVATPKPGVVVHVSALTSVTGKATGIGEVSGPAIRFDVTVTNRAASAIPLSTAVVNVTSGSAKMPADELVSSRTPFPASLAVGKSATAVYTFSLAKTDRKNVAISFDYRAGTPVVAFTGAAPA